MGKLEFEIAGGLGDNLIMRIFFDTIKHNYNQIRIAHSKSIIDYWRDGDPKYFKFLNDIGNLLFSEPPYIYDHGKYKQIDIANVVRNLHITPRKPNLDHLLCKGSSLNLGEEYIVITTKIRLISKWVFYSHSTQLWAVIRELSKKYKIVVLGERDVEISKEYKDSSNVGTVYCIYEQIIANLPSDRIVDLTVPALGISTPDLTKIQQDCVIMKGAKFVITFGIGGNLWLSLAVANTIGFRSEPPTGSRITADFYAVTDLLNNPQFTSAFITKDVKLFLEKLRSS